MTTLVPKFGQPRVPVRVNPRATEGAVFGEDLWIRENGELRLLTLADLGGASVEGATLEDIAAAVGVLPLDAATLNGQAGTYYLDWPNFTNTPTTLAGYGISQLTLPEIAEPAAPAANFSTLYVTDSNGITELELKDSTGLVHHVGEELLTRVRNTSGSTLNVGEAVYVSGSTGGTPNVSRARADAAATVPCAGLVVESIANNGFGRVIFKGVISGFDTSAFAEGDPVWLSATTAGALVSTAPAFPNLVQKIGIVTNSGVGNGSVLVNVDAVIPPFRLASFTVGTLPAATSAGQMIYVTDESGGAVPAFSDGANWRRVTDRAVVA